MSIRTSSPGPALYALSYALVFAAGAFGIFLMNAGDTSHRLTWDDAYILLSGSRTLLETGRVALTPDHPPFVGLTAFGYVSLVSLFGLLVDDLEVVARWLGVVLTLGACLGFHSFLLLAMKRGVVSRNLPAATLGSAMFAMSGQATFNAWTGMDTSLALFVFVWYLVAFLRYEAHPVSGILAAALFFVRPDALIFPLLAGLLFVGRLLFRPGESWRAGLPRILSYTFAAGIPILILTAVVYSYLGSPFPNTISTRMYFYGEMCADLSKRVADGFLAIGMYGATIQWFAGLALIGLIPGPAAATTANAGPASVTANQLRILFLAFACLTLLPFVYMYPSGIVAYQGRYLILIFAMMMMFATIGIVRIADWIQRLYFLSHPAKRAVQVLALALLAYYGYREHRGEWRRLHAFHIEASDFHEALYRQATWVRENTSPESRVSITDLGVMIFYSERKIVDAVGLANPEMQAYYRTPDGACIPPAERDMSDFARRFDLDYVIAADEWVTILMGDFVQNSTLPLQRIDGVPGYPIYRVIRPPRATPGDAPPERVDSDSPAGDPR